MFHRRPTGLTALASGTGQSLAYLTALEGFARAVLVGVVPLLAFDALGSKEAVARIYLLAAIFTLLITLNFGRLERWLQRRWVLTLGGGFLVIAAGLLYWGSGIWFALGIGLRSAAASIFTVCMSLYIMEFIHKLEFRHAESRRMMYTGVSWLLAPVIGVWCWDKLSHASVFLMSVFAACLMVAYFWRLRLGSNQVLVRSTNRRHIPPLKLLPRYFGQKHLRIAYLITLSRSMFWVTLYVYGPIYAVEAGLPTWVGAGLLSLSCAMLFFSPFVRRMAERFQTRRMISLGLGMTGVSLLVLGVLGKAQPIGLLFWWLASVGAAFVDVLGNIPFMRTVKPYERTEMTMVFSTWREMSELLTPLVISLLLLFWPFSAFYWCLGGFLLAIALVATTLPRRL